MNKKTICSLMIVFSLIAHMVLSNPSFSLLQIACDGRVTRIPSGQATLPKLPFNAQRGMLFLNDFYSINEDGKIVVTELKNSQKKEVIDPAAFLNHNLKPFQIVKVDQDQLILGVYTYDASKQLKDQWTCYMYRVQRSKLTAEPLIAPGYDGNFASENAGKVYYSDKSGEIFCNNNNHVKPMKLRGRSPSVSPDGTKIAFISFSIFTEGVYIYDIKKDITYRLKRFFGPKSVSSIIRWSNDGSLLAFKENSDLFKTSLYIIDVPTRTIIHELPKNDSCNWFFES